MLHFSSVHFVVQQNNPQTISAEVIFDGSNTITWSDPVTEEKPPKTIQAGHLTTHPKQPLTKAFGSHGNKPEYSEVSTAITHALAELGEDHMRNFQIETPYETTNGPNGERFWTVKATRIG